MVDSIRDCVVDSARLAPLRECMGFHDLKENVDPPADEWKHGLLHPDTVAFSCGQLMLSGGLQEHNHDPNELRLCCQLAEEAAQIISGTDVNLSESSSTFEPFYITANRGAEVPLELTPEFIQLVFCGIIYPQAEVVVQPFQEGNLAWDHFVVVTDPTEELKYTAPDDVEEFWEERRQRVGAWQRLFDWFESREELHGSAYVMIGVDEPPSDTNRACVFPRLFLAITRSGSLVGICSHAVHT